MSLIFHEHLVSVCAPKVRLTLLEKGIEYESRFVDLRSGQQLDPKYLKTHPDPHRRMRQRSVYQMGINSPFVIDAVKDYQGLISEIEKNLAGGPFLGVGAYSLADAAATPCIHRLFFLDLLGVWAAENPLTLDWFDRIRAHTSFDEGITKHFTDADATYLRPVDDDAVDSVAAILRG